MKTLIGGLLIQLTCVFPAFAVVNGHSLAVPTLGLEMQIRKATVRFIERVKNQDRMFCSGVLAGPGEILSAGHCFEGRASRAVWGDGSIFAEIYDDSMPGRVKRIPVADVRTINNARGDLALVTLAQDGPEKASLPIAYAGCDANSDYISAGFGIDERNQAAKSLKISHYVQMSTDEKERLNNALNRFQLTENWLFLRSKFGKACRGDSGGPILCRSQGRLSIVGINASIALAGKTITDDLSFIPSWSCDQSDLLLGTHLSAAARHIERLRANVGESSLWTKMKGMIAR